VVAATAREIQVQLQRSDESDNYKEGLWVFDMIGMSVSRKAPVADRQPLGTFRYDRHGWIYRGTVPMVWIPPHERPELKETPNSNEIDFSIPENLNRVIMSGRHAAFSKEEMCLTLIRLPTLEHGMW